ncbi:F0F1 ATP synthase subunit A [Neofamilia massiliensis]|uniref:F0F1 ATP synthase subunit A n=1 Tax=Neofamilia massiliensis TaxID=1673724 RepID=UPI0006BB7471|nr:F0F1 ATP synthase subunit A [Neofamilia massiliensis]
MKKKPIYVFAALIIASFVLSFIIKAPQIEAEPISQAMKDAVVHNENKILFLGREVNPGLVSAVTVSGIILLGALIIRIFFIPRFSYVPSKGQIIIEEIVGYFNNLAKSNSPDRNKFLGAYIFAAGLYVFVGTIFELFGIQALTTTSRSLALPAPLSDINGAIALGGLSYLVILGGGLVANGPKGLLKGLKDFSLPLSMSFRLFGALLSGLLVNELIYHYVYLSYGLPVVVAIVFTLLHAVIQAYVLTILTSLFYGEVSEKHGELKK